MKIQLIIFISVLIFFLIPMSIASPIDKGNALFFEGRFSEALRFYSQSLSEMPYSQETPRAMFSSALCYLRIGNRDMALKALWQLVGDYPASEWADNAFMELARLRELAGRESLGEALLLYETIPSRYPRSEKLAEAILGSARVKMGLGYYEYAHDTLQKVIERFGSFEETAEFHYDIATIYAHPQNPERSIRKALDHLEVISTRFPGSDILPKVYLFQGKLQWEAGNRLEALQLFREVIIRASGNPIAEFAQESIARIYEEMGDLQRAVNAYRILQVKYSFSDETRKRLQVEIDRFISPSSESAKPTISSWRAKECENGKCVNYDGDVRISLEKAEIFSDHAIVNTSDGLITANGNIRLRWSNKYVIYCDSISCNVKKRYILCEGKVGVQTKTADGVRSESFEKIRLSFEDENISKEGV